MDKNNKLTLLDCTFRDGGYYNSWDFRPSLVIKYLHAVVDANIDIIELGFRNFPQESFLGAFAYTTDMYIDSLNIDDHILVGVMIDANSILTSEFTIFDALKILFQSKKNSRVDLVRVATHFENIEECFEIVKVLKKMGYYVGLNLMQSNSQSDGELLRLSTLVHNWKLVDVLYFADSLGSMESVDVVRIISLLKSNWTGNIGFHAHNNKGLAVSNTLVAIENGVTWCDCTIMGMGRGSGNAQTENLIIELTEKYQLHYKVEALFNLILSDFSPLREHYKWGESILYNLAAKNNIHPTYIQEMITDNRYSNVEVLQAIEFMSTIDTSHYDKELLLSAHGNTNNKGSWNAKNWCLDKEVLILGSGKSIQIYQEAIIQYIKLYKPLVISLNIQSKLPSKFIDIYTSSSESKMLEEYALYERLTKPLIISNRLLGKVLKNTTINIKKLWDYGLNISPNTFIIKKSECTLPYELSFGYALALASIGNASSISLVGFDGYKGGDDRQVRMNELIDLYKNQSTQPIIALTPSDYNINQGSIYANKL